MAWCYVAVTHMWEPEFRSPETHRTQKYAPVLRTCLQEGRDRRIPRICVIGQLAWRTQQRPNKQPCFRQGGGEDLHWRLPSDLHTHPRAQACEDSHTWTCPTYNEQINKRLKINTTKKQTKNWDKLSIRETSDLHAEYFKNSFLCQEHKETTCLNKQPTSADRSPKWHNQQAPQGIRGTEPKRMRNSFMPIKSLR